MRKAYWGAIAIAFAAFLWAFDGVVLTPWVMKLGLYDVPTFVFMLHFTASIFLSYFLFKKKDELKNLTRKDRISFLLVGLFGGAIGTMAIVGAILMVYSHGLNIAVVLLLQKLQPIFAILLALLYLKERPHKQFYFWAVIAVLGSYFLTFGFAQPDFSAEGMFIPAMLAVLAAFSFGSSTVFSKHAVTKVSHGLGTALRFSLTTLIMLVIITIISLLETAGVELSYAGFSGFNLINWHLIGAFLVIAFTTGGTAIFIYYYVLKRVTASQSTMYELAFPISAIVLEFLIHDKVLTAGQWVGAIVMLLAVVCIARLKQDNM
jgi:drug/metabolite transporter (DMT)-like permease